MKLLLNRDYLNSPIPPRVFLCTPGQRRMAELQAFNRQLTGKWSTYSDFSFDIQRTYVDMLTGETKIHPAYDKVEVPRCVFVENCGYFVLQDIDDTSGDNDIKSVSCFSSEYATSNKYLTNWHINTGEVDSVEVLYNESQFGLDYSSDRDSFYKFASGEYDPYESYYKRQYTDSDSYTYEQIQIANEAEYSTLINASNNLDGQLSEKLYVKNFPNVQFYNENRKGLSLMHLIFEYLPEWEIGNVDKALWHKERKFSEDRVSIYDFLMNNVAETFDCSFVWDSLTGKVHIYQNADDDDVQNEASTRWDTDVFISKDNLASETKVKYSADNIKTKLVVAGADDLNIREVNLGGNSIMDLSFYHTEEWMERDLYERYSAYLAELQEAETGKDVYGLPSKKYTMSYPDAVQGWVAANNRYHELMNTIPSETNTLLVGDEFKKLFCVYAPIISAYAKDIEINSNVEISELYYDEQCTVPVSGMKDGSTYIVQNFKVTYSLSKKKFIVGDYMILNSKRALIKKLNQYHVDEDTKANKQDNILLKLKNASSDVATIRIYDAKAVVPSGSVIDEDVAYYTLGSNGTYTKITVNSVDEFNGGNIYTNNYMIQSIISYASSNTTGDVKTYTLDQWLTGELTAKMNGTKGMDLEGYTVSYIGTMGAYFVLAKDEVIVTDDGLLEVSDQYLNSCGVNLLKEKHKIYTSIFQTQTEAMLSQEKYQCIVQSVEPQGTYAEGTRWLDADSSPVTLYVYKLASGSNKAGWYPMLDPNKETVSTQDQYNYENYQRYLDNYNKLKAVQEHLAQKEREAEYCKYGYKVDASINLNDGSNLKENMQRIAEKHMSELRVLNKEPKPYSVLGQIINSEWPLYTFMTSYDPIVYERNTKPYNNVEKYYLKNYYYPAPISTQQDFNEYANLYVISSQEPLTYTLNTKSYDSSVQYYAKSDNVFNYTIVNISSRDVFNKYGKTEDTALYIKTSGHVYAVYLQNGTPYVAYENSEGVYDMIQQYIRNETDMSNPKFFNTDQWIRLSPFIKEDEFVDSNFLLTGYESEEERISICKELMDAATKELKTLCKPSLEFSMTLANLFALPEFSPLVDNFQLGNFIRVGIREGYVKRARLLEVRMNFDDLSDFDCTFGNLKTTKSEIDKHAELLSQAVTAGKQVAKSANTWQRTTEKANQIEEDINGGLQDAALKIKNASGQSIEIGENGLIGRKLIDGTTDQYENEQVAIINNKLVFTSDNWNTSKACFGEFTVGGQTRWGVLADAILAGYLESPTIVGGSLRVGGTGGQFIVNEDGSVQILGPQGQDKYADNRFQVELEYTGSTVFSDFNDKCIITCHIYDSNQPINNRDITDKVIANGGTFVWSRSMSGWNISDRNIIKDENGKQIINKISITHEDIERNATFTCAVSFDDTKFDI